MISKIFSLRNYIMKQIMKTDEAGIMQIPDKGKVDFGEMIIKEDLFRKGIDPKAITSESQLDNILNTPTVSPKPTPKKSGEVIEVDFDKGRWKDIDPEKKAGGGRTGLNYLLGEDDQNSRVPFAGGLNAARRAFLKMMGAGAAGVGAAKSGLFGLLKGGGGKKVVTEVAKDVAGSGQPPAYFFNLVKKIKNLGDDVTETASTAPHQKVHKYKDYELTENVSEGYTEINKKGQDIAEDVYMSYKVDDVPIKGKKKSTKVEEYEEYTARPDQDGKMKDVEMGVPDEVVEEGTIFEDTISEFTKKASGGRVPLGKGGIAGMLGE